MRNAVPLDSLWVAGNAGEELTMVTLWEDLDALKNMTGEGWESQVMPDLRAEELIAEVFLAPLRIDRLTARVACDGHARPDAAFEVDWPRDRFDNSSADGD